MKQRSTIRSLQLIHRTMLLGLFVLAAAAFYLKYTHKFPSSLTEKDQLLQLIALAVSFAGVFAGASVFKKRIMAIRDTQQGISEKAAAFRSICILQWALLEGPALFSIICFLLVGNLAFLALAAAVMLWFGLTGPSKMKTMLLLRLSESDMEDF
jgi:hypothetical protein